MKKPTKGWLSAVCVISIRARFTTVVVTGLWPVHLCVASPPERTRVLLAGISCSRRCQKIPGAAIIFIVILV